MRSMVALTVVMLALSSKSTLAATPFVEICSIQCLTYCPGNPWQYCDYTTPGDCGIGASCGTNFDECFGAKLICYGYAH